MTKINSIKEKHLMLKKNIRKKLVQLMCGNKRARQEKQLMLYMDKESTFPKEKKKRVFSKSNARDTNCT